MIPGKIVLINSHKMILDMLKEQKRKVTVKNVLQHVKIVIIFTIFYGFSKIAWQRFSLFFENLYDIADFNFDPFYASVPFLYPLEASANRWFSDVFMGYSNGAFA